MRDVTHKEKEKNRSIVVVVMLVVVRSSAAAVVVHFPVVVQCIARGRGLAGAK